MIAPHRNGILDMLPRTYRDMLISRMELVDLPISTHLYASEETPRYAHFMTAGVAAAVTLLDNGNGIEVGLTGREGLVEAIHLLGFANLPSVAFVLVKGEALRMSFTDLRNEFNNCEPLRRQILRTVQVQIAILGQMTACNRLHSLQARLARWLLMVQDRVGESRFTLTHEFLSQMVGVRRSTVTVAAGNLQKLKLIGYHWGQIDILDREGLLQAACECYAVVEKLTSTPAGRSGSPA